jgi:hypothetical protein
MHGDSFLVNRLDHSQGAGEESMLALAFNDGGFRE